MAMRPIARVVRGKDGKIRRIEPEGPPADASPARENLSEAVPGGRPATDAAHQPEPIPAEMAGRYIVWSADGLRIAGHGKTIAEARATAGVDRGGAAVVQKIPPVRGFIKATGCAAGSAQAEGVGAAIVRKDD